ncbi:MAG: Nif3-like dinuclear metal center hexameric protein [Eubacteriales bacterium]|nr:Nif3-like dinuclear metal center hexameric protein [Eubacteriales bacterium]
MKIKDFCELMEEIAPRTLAMEGDNVGLLVGTDRDDIKKVLVALDCTVEIAKEAVAWGADLVLTHHPLFFHPIQRFGPDYVDSAAAYILARNGIGMFAAHTNLDAAAGGVNDVLASLLGLSNVVPLEPDKLGRIGELGSPVTLGELIERCEAALHCKCRFCGNICEHVCKVAVIGGSGGGDIFEAWKNGADAFVTGEAKYGQGIEADVLGLKVITCGHYETESVVLNPLISRLQNEKNDVEYRIAKSKYAALCSYFGGEHE